MRMQRALLVSAGVVLAMALAWGCLLYVERTGGEGRVKHGDGSARLTLGDGRRVSLSYGERGLVERHQSARDGPWSKPRLLYRTKELDCESLTLATHGDTVAAAADYGYDCGAGGPPDYSIAAVATRDDLDGWDVKVVKFIDGFDHVRFSSSGNHVRFDYPTAEGGATLSWRSFWGFSQPDS
ncbi:hypothetical protein OIE63_28875 [Streptomyces sp. NBC_01795]|uniref:hypothetical protein n=1 Tax=Streptomyces sp. NBC_01795 TaxID=2975943 RepID=UPI002DD8D49F|nr:hypothetical protein [Streptomyces sp. NBC_01795]WSA95120.1 hypothetical protein OIE63_28875 [Streptomyces sp. NBC_01795]